MNNSAQQYETPMNIDSKLGYWLIDPRKCTLTAHSCLKADSLEKLPWLRVVRFGYSTQDQSGGTWP